MKFCYLAVICLLFLVQGLNASRTYNFPFEDVTLYGVSENGTDRVLFTPFDFILSPQGYPVVLDTYVGKVFVFYEPYLNNYTEYNTSDFVAITIEMMAPDKYILVTTNGVFQTTDFVTFEQLNISTQGTYLLGVAFDPRENILYTSDALNSQVNAYDLDTLNLVNSYGGYTNVSRPGETSTTSLSNPELLAVDNQGGLWVVDTGNNRVLHFPAGSNVADIVLGQPDFTTKEGGAFSINNSAQLFNPNGVALDESNQNIYVSDQTGRVLRWTAPFTIGQNASGVLDTATDLDGGFNIYAVRVRSNPDGSVRVFYSDSGNGRIVSGQAIPAASASSSATPTASPTSTSSASLSSTSTASLSSTSTASLSSTSTASLSSTSTVSLSATSTASLSSTSTASLSSTSTASVSATSTPSLTSSASPSTTTSLSATSTASLSSTSTASFSATSTASLSSTSTASVSATSTPSLTSSASPSTTASLSATSAASLSSTSTASLSSTSTASLSATSTASLSATSTASLSATASASLSATSAASLSTTSSASQSSSSSASLSATSAASVSTSSSISASPSGSASALAVLPSESSSSSISASSSAAPVLPSASPSSEPVCPSASSSPAPVCPPATPSPAPSGCDCCAELRANNVLINAQIDEASTKLASILRKLNTLNAIEDEVSQLRGVSSKVGRILNEVQQLNNNYNGGDEDYKRSETRQVRQAAAVGQESSAEKNTNWVNSLF